MTARCVTARVGPAAGWVVAFMYGDERKTSRLSLAVSALTRKMTSFFLKVLRPLSFERQERFRAH